MKTAEQPFAREHHFYVSTAKFVFHHSEYGIVSVRDPIKLKDAERYALSPLILYGLTIPGIPLRWMTFAHASQPRAFSDVLLEAWRNAKGLRGQPDTLLVSRHLALASPELSATMAKIGVELNVADATEKSLPASMRSAQDASRWLRRIDSENDRTLAGAVEAICQEAQVDHDFQAKGRRGMSNRKLEDRIQRWLSLPVRQPEPIPTERLDWLPGPWLSAWETSLPPEQPRYFHLANFDGRTWLHLGEEESDDPVEDDDLWTEKLHDNLAELTKNLVGCWPNTLTDIATSAGMTLRQLKWFMSRKATLDPHTRLRLAGLLGVKYDERIGCYTAAGPYVLMAQKAKALEEIYQDISGGGDACPCEIVPREGPADPSWRYVLINPFGKPPTLVMSPRGEKITERLADLMMNYEGIRPVSQMFYRDVVANCARACREPTANIREMKKFAKRYERHWMDGVWLPE